MIELNRLIPLRLTEPGTALLLCLLLLFHAVAVNADEANDTWRSLNVVDADTVDWDERFSMGKHRRSKGKVLYSNEDGAALLYINFVPGWDAYLTNRHYHDFHEWGYVLEGNFMHYEFVSPAQTLGSLVRMRKGTWMSRPAYSIHANRADVMAWQKIPPASVHLAFSSGGETLSLDPESRRYKDTWKDVKHWTNPHIQHSAVPEEMEWETDRELPGVSIKWLSDDWQGGFRSVLRYAPPGWSHPGAPQRVYFNKAQRFHYILYGDLKVGTAANPGAAGQHVVVNKDYFIDQPPKSIWGWPEGPLTENGAMWLEVTYAEGTRVGNGPIEAPVRLQ